jgi:mevalonate kinase
MARGLGEGRARGKVILLGEHAVVYGVPAIAVGIERGAVARAEARDAGPSRLVIRGWGIDVAENDEDRDLGRAFRALLEASGTKEAVRVELAADLPPGGGLGCSAAMGVAVARALDRAAGDEQVIERAMAWERVFHGNPSGIDASVSAHGGTLLFQKGQGTQRIAGATDLLLCVGHTGVASSTRTMVELVARQKARRPQIVEKTFEGIRALVANAREALETGDRASLGKLMDLNQMLLSGLMLSTEETERLCDLARAQGALGAKLTGAGGGGCVVALVPSRATAERVLEAWKSAGFEGFHTDVLPTAQAARASAEATP